MGYLVAPLARVSSKTLYNVVFLENIRFRPIYTMSGGDVGLICIQSDIKEAHRIHVS